MAKVFPGGSSVTRNFPAVLAGGGDVPSWELVKEFDWTSFGTITLTTGTTTQNGIVWTPQNNTSTDDDQFTISAADGLKFILTGSATPESHWWGTNQSGAILSAPLGGVGGIFPTYSLKDTLSIQALCEFTVDTPGDDGGYFLAGITIFTGAVGGSGAGLWYATYWFALNLTTDNYSSRYGGGSASASEGDNYDNVVTADKPSFLELVSYPGTGWTALGSLDTTYQDPLTVTPFRAFGNMELQLPKNMGTGGAGGTANPGRDPAFTLRPDNMRIGMFAAYKTPDGGTRNSKITCRFKGLRVMKRV